MFKTKLRKAYEEFGDKLIKLRNLMETAAPPNSVEDALAIVEADLEVADASLRMLSLDKKWAKREIVVALIFLSYSVAASVYAAVDGRFFFTAVNLLLLAMWGAHLNRLMNYKDSSETLEKMSEQRAKILANLKEGIHLIKRNTASDEQLYEVRVLLSNGYEIIGEIPELAKRSAYYEK